MGISIEDAVADTSTPLNKDKDSHFHFKGENMHKQNGNGNEGKLDQPQGAGQPQMAGQGLPRGNRSLSDVPTLPQYLGNPRPFPQQQPAAFGGNPQSFGRYGNFDTNRMAEKRREHAELVVGIESFFAQYLLDIATYAKENVDKFTDEQKKLVIPMQMEVRSLREFIVLQAEYRATYNQGPTDPFFKQSVMPVLVPVYDAEYEVAFNIPLFDYVRSVFNNYRNFNYGAGAFNPVQLFGGIIQVILSKDDPREEHKVVLPQVDKLFTLLFEHLVNVPQPLQY